MHWYNGVLQLVNTIFKRSQDVELQNKITLPTSLTKHIYFTIKQNEDYKKWWLNPITPPCPFDGQIIIIMIIIIIIIITIIINNNSKSSSNINYDLN